MPNITKRKKTSTMQKADRIMAQERKALEARQKKRGAAERKKKRGK